MLQRFGNETDLILEARELGSANEGKIPGVTTQELSQGGITISRVHIENEQGMQAMGKPVGMYVTVELPRDFQDDNSLFEVGVSVIAAELKKQLNLSENGCVMIAGLGNAGVTPDALGPETVQSVLVTRHIEERAPEYFKSNRMRPVAAIAPGVMGQTGVETAEIIASIVSKIRPEAVIVIDALSARSLSRLAVTVQISDTGINPGAGVGNQRSEITKESLGVPVVSIGMPTVVNAATLVADATAIIASKGGTPSEESRDSVYDLAKEALTPYGLNLFVTPKDIDGIIACSSRLIGYSINMALQNNMSVGDMSRLLS